jgi:hypothetical protein
VSDKKKTAVLIAASLLAVFGMFRFVYGEGGQPEPSAPTVDAASILNPKEGTFPYRSNNYTMPEQPSAAIAVRSIPSDFEQVGESGKLTLYMSRKSLAIMVKNKATGYVWSSAPKETDIESGGLNGDWKTAVKSPLLITYYDENDMLINGSYLSLGGKVDAVEAIPQGLRIKLNLTNIQAGMALEVKLDGDSLVVSVPQPSMWEKGKSKLASIQPYPFLGAVHKADIPGYLFIPDRSGALIRFNKAHTRFDEPYVGKIYGMDIASDNMESYSGETPVPVFGIVHGPGQNGLLGIVEDGRYNAEITAYPSGLNTDFYWVSPKFTIRYGYFQPTSKTMGGYNTFQKEAIASSRQVRYLFLGGDQADYVGMAKSYRSYLQGKGELVQMTKPGADIPLQVQLFGGETEPGLLHPSVVAMTTFNQARTIIDRLAAQGITHVTAEYKGWSDGGANGTRPAEFPVESKLGGQSGLKKLQQYLTGKRIPLYLTNDYTNAFEGTDLLSFRKDAVRSLSNEIVEYPFFGWSSDEAFEDIMTRFISPGKARKIGEADTQKLRKIGIDGLALEGIGQFLFSDYNAKHAFTREQAAGEYRKLAETVSGGMNRNLAMYMPSDYMWKYTNAIFGMSLGSSQYMYETDTVPFLQVLLHGIVDYYARPVNFNSSPREDMLRMVEFGAYPSVLMTYEPYSKLRDTPSTDLLATQYTDLEQPTKELYDMSNQALKQVQAATIESREVPAYGIVNVAYSNGIRIIVNYTSSDYTLGGVIIKAKSFAVIGGE